MDVDEVFNDSYRRVVGQNGAVFFDVFYKRFLAKSQDIATLFSDTDMERQREMLEASMLHMINFASTRKAEGPMQALAELHAELGVKIHHFNYWVDALVESVEEVDEQYSDQDGVAWQIMLSPGLAYMKSYAKLP